MAPARAPNDALARARLLFLCTSVSSILFYVGTSYGLLRSPRFLFPLYCVLPVVLGVGTSEIWQRSRPLAALLLSTVLGCNLAVQLAAHPALALQPVHYVGQLDVPQSYRELVSCLDGLGVDRVYGGYWTSFPLVLASQERILVSHGAPGRLPEADRAVAAATRVAFLFYRGKLDEMQFRVLLGRAGVRNRAWDCGPFRLYTEIDADALRRSPLWGRVLAVLAHP